MLGHLRLDDDVRTLVVRAALRDALRARAEARNRHQHLHPHFLAAVVDLADQARLVVHEARHAGDRRGLHDEVREAHLDVAGRGVEAPRHFREHLPERFHRDLALVLVQHLDEARHVRALEVVGQGDVHVEVGDGVLLAGAAILDAHRVVDVLDPHLVDRDLPGVFPALDVFHRCRGLHWAIHGQAAPGRPPAAASTAGCAGQSRAIERAMPAASRLAMARQSSREPCSMKRSGMPMW